MQALAIQLDSTGGTATSGTDYAPLPSTLVIPAGKSSASIDLLPLYDGVAESEERFQIKVLPNASYVIASPTEANVIIEASAAAPDGALLIEEDFGGSSATGLAAKSADLFDAVLINAGGSSTWRAGTAFRANGSVTADTAQTSASLDLGTYINSRKGQPDGKFILTATISENTGAWISLGFSQANAPSITQNFTAASGIATILYRAQNGSPAGELDLFPILNSNVIDGPDANTGPRTLSVTLDLTPSGGYNGTSHHGSVTWSDSALGTLGTHNFTSNVNFGSILLSEANSSAGSVSALTLRQILPSTNTFATWIGGFGLAPVDWDFNDDPDSDGLANGIEAWLGTHPGQSSSGLAMLSPTTFTHPRNPTPPADLAATYQWSPNLVDWYLSSTGPPGGPAVTLSTEASGSNTTITAAPSGVMDRLFLRLAVIDM
jgi:hypothetical protein